MYLDDANVFASNIIDKYLTEATSSYVKKKAGDVLNRA